MANFAKANLIAMKIIVFGASGSVGRAIVKQGLESGFEITAFVRNPDQLLWDAHPNLRVFKGDVLQIQDIEQALTGQDAVLCALGDGNVGKIRGIGTSNIIKGMHQTGIQRLICQSTIGAGDSYKNLNFLWKHLMFGFLLKRVLPDHNAQEKYIYQSGLDYTIVRPSALKDGPRSETYHAILDGTPNKKLSLRINRVDVADFMLNQVFDPAFIKSAVQITN